MSLNTYPQRVNSAPSTFSGYEWTWLTRLGDALNAFPPFSSFSTSNPNSYITATVGTFGVNYSSGTSSLWWKQIGSGTTGWVPIA